MIRNLEVLIPTYNRSDFLIENVENLIVMILTLRLQDRVSILISNNASTDNTLDALHKIDSSRVLVKVFSQESNVGLEKNALFCLANSMADFVMYLGDDDYISECYLQHIINLIDRDCDLSTIVPNFFNVDTHKKRISANRDDISESFDINANRFDIVRSLSWRAHQMSGLIFKREGVYESYLKEKVSNIYPFIYFITKSSFVGNCYHVADFPIAVTSPSQDSKDWDYGDDGLLDEVFNNYKSMPNISYIQRVLLESTVLNMHRWRYAISFKTSPILFLKAVYNSENTTLVTKLMYSYRLVKLVCNNIARRIIRNGFTK